MRISRFYFPHQLSVGTTQHIRDEYRHRLVNVLRLKEGDDLVLFNGESETEYNCTVSRLQKKEIEINIIDVVSTHTESALDLTLWQAVSRSDRMDFAIQKAVELGVKTIQPVTTERSPYKLKNQKLDKKMDHWRNIIIHACEQSGRCMLPILHTPENLPVLLLGTELLSPSNQWILAPGATRVVIELKPEINKEIRLLIGAEGGFTEEEYEQCNAAGFVSVSAGPRILRTETAATAMLSWAQICFGDMSQ